MIESGDVVSKTKMGDIIEIGNEKTGMQKYLKAVNYKTGTATLTDSKERAKWYPCFSEAAEQDEYFLLPWIKQNGFYITTVSYNK